MQTVFMRGRSVEPISIHWYFAAAVSDHQKMFCPVCCWSGNITAICLFTSPVPTFSKIVKKKTVAEFSGIPYVCTLLNCLLWVVYGLPIVEFQVLVISINAAGCLIEFTYLALYLTYAQKSIRVSLFLLAIL